MYANKRELGKGLVNNGILGGISVMLLGIMVLVYVLL